MMGLKEKTWHDINIIFLNVQVFFDYISVCCVITTDAKHKQAIIPDWIML